MNAVPRLSQPHSPAPRVRSRLRGIALTTAAVALAVALGVSGAGVTYAFLTASATQKGAVITAGTAAIQINGSTAAALGNQTLSPSTPAVWAFTVANTGSVKMDISAAIAATNSPAYAPAARALLVPVAPLSAARRRH